jgi:3-hydroxyisobutyrate dehydrogenase-like beta-hydroxyacid dehydrogenase
MIPTHTHVQSVYTGAPSSSSGTSSSVSPDSTVLAALKGGKLGKNEVENTLCIEQSTIRMDVSQQVGKEIEGAGGMWVDAPVSGGESSRCPRHRRHYYINLISSASDTI